MSNALAFWGSVVLAAWGYSLGIVTTQKLYKPLLIIAVFVSIAPIAWVAFDCYQIALSEACSWGKSLLILYIALSVVLLAPIIFLIYYFIKKTWNLLKAI